MQMLAFLPLHLLLSERWTDEIILMVKLHRKTTNWRRSIRAFNEVVVCEIPRRNPTSAFWLPGSELTSVCVSRFYRSDGESPAESSSEPLFSVNNSGTSRTRGSDRPGWESSVLLSHQSSYFEICFSFHSCKSWNSETLKYRLKLCLQLLSSNESSSLNLQLILS